MKCGARVKTSELSTEGVMAVTVLPDSPGAFKDAVWEDVLPYYEELATRPRNDGRALSEPDESLRRGQRPTFRAALRADDPVEQGQRRDDSHLERRGEDARAALAIPPGQRSRRPRGRFQAASEALYRAARRSGRNLRPHVRPSPERRQERRLPKLSRLRPPRKEPLRLHARGLHALSCRRRRSGASRDRANQRKATPPNGPGYAAAMGYLSGRRGPTGAQAIRRHPPIHRSRRTCLRPRRP